ncbi:hypothetical protein IWQ61_000204 [Dispira simplex]|nr:hypothetical protein IWQ61_000204 [Dispira simplex]
MDPPLDSLDGTDLFNMDLSFDQATLDTTFDSQFGDTLLNQTFNDMSPTVSRINSQISAAMPTSEPQTLESEWPFGDGTFDTNSLLDFSGTEDLVASFMKNDDSSNTATQNVPMSNQGNRMIPTSQPITTVQHHPTISAVTGVSVAAPSLGMGSLPPNATVNMANLQMLGVQGQSNPSLNHQFLPQFSTGKPMAPHTVPLNAPGPQLTPQFYGTLPSQVSPMKSTANPSLVGNPPAVPMNSSISASTTLSHLVSGAMRPPTLQVSSPVHPGMATGGLHNVGGRPPQLSPSASSISGSLPQTPTTTMTKPVGKGTTPSTPDKAKSITKAGSEERGHTPKKLTYNPMVAGKTTLKKMQELRSNMKFPENCIDPAMLRKLYDMTYEEFTNFLTNFLRDFIQKHPERKNVKEFKNPQLDNTDVNLQQLFKFVIGSGGFLYVARQKLWKAIGIEMRVSQNNPAAPLLRRWYDDFLLPVEETYVFPRDISGMAEIEANLAARLKKGKVAAKRKANATDPLLSPIMSSPSATPEPLTDHLPSVPFTPTSGTKGLTSHFPLATSPASIPSHLPKRSRTLSTLSQMSMPTSTESRTSTPADIPATKPSWQPAVYQTTPTGGHDLTPLLHVAQRSTLVPNVLHGGAIRIPDLVLSLQSRMDMEVSRAVNTLVQLSYYYPQQVQLTFCPDLMSTLIDTHRLLFTQLRNALMGQSQTGHVTPPLVEADRLPPLLTLPDGQNGHMFESENYSAPLVRACEYSLALGIIWQNLASFETNAQWLAQQSTFVEFFQQMLGFHHQDNCSLTKPRHWLYLQEFRKVLLNLLASLAPQLEINQRPLATHVVNLVSAFTQGYADAVADPVQCCERYGWMAMEAFCKLTTTDHNRACLAQLDSATLQPLLDNLVGALTAWDLKNDQVVAPNPLPTSINIHPHNRTSHLSLVVLALYSLTTVVSPECLPVDTVSQAAEVMGNRAPYTLSLSPLSPTRDTKDQVKTSLQVKAQVFRRGMVQHKLLVPKLLATIIRIQKEVGPAATTMVPRETLAQVAKIQQQGGLGPGRSLPNLTIARAIPLDSHGGSTMGEGGIGGGTSSLLSKYSPADSATPEAIICTRSLEILTLIFPSDAKYARMYLDDLITLLQCGGTSVFFTQLVDRLIKIVSK